MSSIVETPRRRLSPDVRRAQLLQAGLRAFIQNGYLGTSLEDIATAAGVTRPLLYRYFKDKDEIFLELIRAARVSLDESLMGAAAQVMADGGTLEDQLRAGLTAYFAFVRDRGPEWELLFGPGHAVTGAVADEMKELRNATVGKVAALVQAGVPALAEHTAMAYAQAISGTAEQLALWWPRDHGPTQGDIVESSMSVLWHGLRAVVEEFNG